jgi:hypothetical protein
MIKTKTTKSSSNHNKDPKIAAQNNCKLYFENVIIPIVLKKISNLFLVFV